MRKKYEQIFQDQRERVAQKLKETDDEFGPEAYQYVYPIIVGFVNSVMHFRDCTSEERLTRIRATLEVLREREGK